MATLPRILRPSPTGALALHLRNAPSLPVRTFRQYATYRDLGASSKSSARRQVTVVNDDGQSFNLILVIAGVLATGAVGYVIYTEILSPESTTNQYHRALRRIKEDSRCVQLLGDPKKLVARGEAAHSRMARNWSITSKKEKDRAGNEHLRFRFYVDGPLNQGTVYVHMIQRPGESEAEYQSLTLDVPGHKRIVLEDDSWLPIKKSGKLFGVRWW